MRDFERRSPGTYVGPWVRRALRVWVGTPHERDEMIAHQAMVTRENHGAHWYARLQHVNEPMQEPLARLGPFATLRAAKQAVRDAGWLS